MIQFSYLNQCFFNFVESVYACPVLLEFATKRILIKIFSLIEWMFPPCSNGAKSRCNQANNNNLMVSSKQCWDILFNKVSRTSLTLALANRVLFVSLTNCLQLFYFIIFVTQKSNSYWHVFYSEKLVSIYYFGKENSFLDYI